MYSNKIFICVVASILFLVNDASAIKCFQCNSGVSPDCFDLTVNDTSSPYFRECNGLMGNATFCRKIKHTILGEEQVVRLTRSCGYIPSKSSKDYCQKHDTDFILEKDCVCSSDGCNGSIKQLANLPTVLGVLVASFLYNMIH